MIVGTVDADGYPSACRAVAATANDDFSIVTIYVPVDTSQQMIANVATTRRVALAITHPIDHGSVQFKGTTRGVRLAREQEGELIRKRLDEFADLLDQIGLPRRITRSITHWPAFAIEINVEQIFNQTPGPKAGQPFA